MPSINNCTVSGNLASDPEIKYLPSGMAVAKLRVAVNCDYKSKSGEWQKETLWLDCEVWGKDAERLNENARKGTKVICSGSLKEDSWEDREGNKRSKIKLRCFVAEVCVGKDGAGASGSGSREAAPQDIDLDLETPF